MSSLCANAQSTYSTEPAPNITGFGGPYMQLNLVDYAEVGAMGGVNFKDVFLLGGYYQHSIRNNNFCGVYTQFNVNPKHYYFHVGYYLKTGVVNGKYLSFEPGMSIQHNTADDRFKFTHAIGFVGGWVSYSFGVWFGNFNEKSWAKPLNQGF